MIWQTNSTASVDTEQLGKLLGKLLNPPALVELRSDLGGGKTTFVRGLTAGFGIRDRVSSPSFTISNIYKNARGQQIHHFDFYRLNEPGIITDQLAESLTDPQVITVIEWSDIVKNVLPDKRLTIEFKPVVMNPDERQIVFRYPESQSPLVKRLETQWTDAKP